MLTLREIATLTLGDVINAAPDTALRIDDVTTDSRTLHRGSLFVALTGERFDGHDYLDEAATRGAAAAIVSKPASSALPLVKVDDTRRALGMLAAGWRRRFDIPVIAVVGSNGKTTTKEMIASVLATAYGRDNACATAANFNNDIGVPTTLLQLRTHHRAAVIEIGMNHPRETAGLAEITKPTVTLVLNAQREHQEFMQSVAAVANEHALAIAALPDDGVAVFPADDEYTPLWRRAAVKRRVVDFACTTDHQAAVPQAAVVGRAHLETGESIVHLETSLGATTVRLAALGMHNVRNATAAAAACIAAGVPLDAIQKGLEAFRPVGGRSQVSTDGGLTIIDDSYNANPDSVRAAIDLLANHPAPRLLVLGDMGEVGDEGPRFHAEVGAHAQARGIEALCALGTASRTTVAAFGERGTHFIDVDALNDAVTRWVAARRDEGAPAVVLVKGSRFMRMERVVAALRGQPVRNVH